MTNLHDFLRARYREIEVIDGARSYDVDPACFDRLADDLDAKRRIIDLHGERSGTGGNWDTDPPSTCNECNDVHPCLTLRLLARPHAKHPEYQRGWSPD
jgi:hypothetical protein